MRRKPRRPSRTDRVPEALPTTLQVDEAGPGQTSSSTRKCRHAGPLCRQERRGPIPALPVRPGQGRPGDREKGVATSPAARPHRARVLCDCPSVRRRQTCIRGSLYKRKAHIPGRNVGPYGSWRRRTLPPGHPGSTIRAAGLNGRVRDGNGCIPCAIATSNLLVRPCIAVREQVYEMLQGRERIRRDPGIGESKGCAGLG